MTIGMISNISTIMSTVTLRSRAEITRAKQLVIISRANKQNNMSNMIAVGSSHDGGKNATVKSRANNDTYSITQDKERDMARIWKEDHRGNIQV
jgi:hypothetical protein